MACGVDRQQSIMDDHAHDMIHTGRSKQFLPACYECCWASCRGFSRHPCATVAVVVGLILLARYGIDHKVVVVLIVVFSPWPDESQCHWPPTV